LLDVRKKHPVFGLGSFQALHPNNPAIFAYVRTYADDIVLCVNNLSGRAQAAELDLSPWEGMYPVELLGRERFPRIGELPYLLTFGAHSFYWFQLVREESE
jgi:maltose alpha-D-glucosyltransferase/alpha-amylase